MEQSFRYRFYPTPEQQSLLRKTLGCVRLVYNRALAARTESWYERQEKIDYIQTSALLTGWKKLEELDFLNEVSCVPLQQGLRHLQKAFSNFFIGRTRYPNFKKKRNGGSAEFTRSAFRWKEGQLWLAKCTEALPIRWSRPLPEGCSPSTVTVKLDARNRWYVSLLVDNPNIQSLPDIDKSIGLDLGITSLIATSNGDKIVNPKPFKRLHKKLRCQQKALSRKQKGTNNRYKTQIKVAKAYGQITDARKDFLHKLTTQLVRENKTIVVEDLAVKNMVKNSKLARSISDAAWGELVRQLEYKCQWYGRTLVKIDRWFPSSKRCGSCGHVVEKMPLNISARKQNRRRPPVCNCCERWECPKCNTTHDRDINAAHNILAAGLAVNVCGANIRPDGYKSKGRLRNTCKGKKQKPKS